MSIRTALRPAAGGPSQNAPPPVGTPLDRGAPAGWRRRLLVAAARIVDLVWRDRRIGAAVAAVTVVVWGLLAGSWMPRGPMTGGQALWSIALSLVVGGVAGFVTRSRWAMLAGPLVLMAAVELARLGTDGPTVDGIRFSTYGVLALVVGRGFHALVSWLPLLWGAALGAGMARVVPERRLFAAPSGRGRRFGGYLRRGVAVLAGVGLVAFSLALARPARTDAIVGPDGETLPGSIAVLDTVDIGGHELGLMIRGHSTDNPVLLFLAGGPGGAERGAMRNHLSALEEHFVVATFEQRGTGTSYKELDPTSTLTLERAVADTIEVTNHLRDRFGQDRIYLVGQSWGSTLGVLAAQERPELYRAFVGVGQMVSQLATDRIFYDDTLAWARSRGDDGLADKLVDTGPPPYKDMLDYETALSYEHEIYPYDNTGNAEGEGGFSENFLVEEHSLVDQVHMLAGFMDTFSVLYPQLQDIDFRRDVTRLEVPVFFAQGAHEADGRAEPFAEWYPMLDAPTKQLTVFDTSGHRPLFEQPDRFVEFMVDTVLAGTADGGAR